MCSNRPPSQYVCQISNVDFRFGQQPILSNVNLSLSRGQTTVVLGESGCGKTTLLRLVAGHVSPTSGSVIVGNSMQASDSNNFRVIYMDQEPLLFEHLNVFENVAFSLRMKRIPNNEVHQRVQEIINSIELTEHTHKNCHELSGGQKQRVAFARAIMSDPDLLLMDEPFGSLDNFTRQTMHHLFQDLRCQYGLTSMFVTHDLKEAIKVGQQFAYMHQGKLISYGSVQEFIDDPRTGTQDEIQFWKDHA